VIGSQRALARFLTASRSLRTAGPSSDLPMLFPTAISGKNSIQFLHYVLDFAGAARGIRTPDPIITNDVLYRLSYCGNLSLR
jgi:hypothetical protein